MMFKLKRGPVVARIPRVALVAAWGLAAVLAGCGGGGGGSEAASDTPIDNTGPGDVSNHFPMAVGDRWVYRKTGSDGTDMLKADYVAETRTVQGLSATVSRRQDVASGQIEDGDEYYVKTGHGVYSLSPDTSPASLVYGLSRVEVLRFPLQPGTQHVSVDQANLDFGSDLDGDGRNERLSARVQTTVEATEAVTVSAGTFTNAARVVTVVKETVTLSRNSQTLSGTITFTDWYAPGVGLVKNRQVGVYPYETVTDELELVAYSVGGQQQPASAPTVTSVTPADGAIVSSSAWSGPVVLTLSGSVAASVPSNALVVRQADGTVLGGQTTLVGGNRLEFRATNDLQPGTYSVTLGSGVTDVLGRPVKVTTTSTFTLTFPDTSAPQIAAYSPLNGTTGLGTDLTFTFDFNEALDPASVKASAFHLTSDTVTYPLQSVELTTPTRITLRAPLDPGQTYSLSVDQTLADTAGNPASGHSSGFSTAGGFNGFYPTRTYGPGGSPAAVQAGDVDGDGLADLVVLMTPSQLDGTAGSSLLIYPHQHGAPLDAHTTLALPQGTDCWPGTASIADVTGDGRTDIVVGTWNCGALVVERSSSGTWSITATVAIPKFNQMLVADVNGDGRPDLVSTRNGEYALNIAYGNASGRFDPVTTITVPMPADYPTYASFNGLAAGDVDGDGRLDLVVLPSTTESTQAVMLLKQRSDGTLGPVSYLPMPGRGTAPSTSALLIGDINGDGRADVVVGGGHANTDSYLLTYTQRSDGSLAAPVSVPAAQWPAAITLTDLDGNGRPDLVVQHGTGSSSRLGVYLQSRHGALHSERMIDSYDPGFTSRYLALADFNGDGLLDLAAPDYTFFRVQYQRPTGNSTVTSQASVPSVRAAVAASRTVTPLSGQRTRFGLRRNPVNSGSAR